MEEKKENCEDCKKGLSNTQWWLIILSLYMFFSSIYVTYLFIMKLIDLF